MYISITEFYSRAISKDLSKIGHFIILISEKQLPRFRLHSVLSFNVGINSSKPHRTQLGNINAAMMKLLTGFNM